MSVVHMDGFDHYVTGTAVIQNASNSLTIEPRFVSAGTNSTIQRSTSAIFPRSSGVTTPTSSTNPGIVSYLLPSPPTSNTIGIGAYFFTNTALTVDHLVFLGFTGGGGYIGVNTTSGGTLRIRTTASTGTAGSTSIIPGTLYHLELKVYRHATLGLAELRINGNLECSFSGDTSLFTPTSILYHNKLTSSSGTSVANLSDLYVWKDDGLANSDWLGERLVHTLNPVSDVSNTWTASSGSVAYAMVDETPQDGNGTYVSSDTVGAEFEVNLSDLPSTNYTPLAVQTVAWAEKTNTGASDIELKLRSGGSEATIVAPLVNGQYNTTTLVSNVDPNGNIPWTAGAVNAMTVAVEKVV